MKTSEDVAEDWRDCARWLRERAKMFSGTEIERFHNEHADECDRKAEEVLERKAELRERIKAELLRSEER